MSQITDEQATAKFRALVVAYGDARVAAANGSRATWPADSSRMDRAFDVVIAALSTPLPPVDGEQLAKQAWTAVQGAAEWGDRTSPDGYEDYLFFKPDELHGILVSFFETVAPASTSPAIPDQVVWRPSYEQISNMVHACRERQKSAGEGDQMLSRWISEGLDGLAPPRSDKANDEVVAVAAALDDFADIDEAEGGNPYVIATERRAAQILRSLVSQEAGE